MSNRATSNRRVQPSRWDLRAEISSRELAREFPQATVETATTGPLFSISDIRREWIK